MDDGEDDARYPRNPSSSFYQSNYHHRRPKLPVRNPSSVPPIPRNYYKEDDDMEEEQEEEDEEENNFKVGDRYNDDNDDDGEEEDDDVVVRGPVEEEDDEDDNEGDDDDDGDGDDNYDESSRYRLAGTDDFPRPAVKRPRRMDRSALAYEFVPRVKAPTAPPPPPAAAAAATASALKPSTGGPPRGSPIADWSEHATFVLLDAWGDRFLQLGRKSLRSEDWIDVAKRVSEASQAVRTDAQCRNRLDTLKKKYKKEKMKALEPGSSASKWVYFKKMEKLLSDSPPPGLSCGVDSGEYVFMNPRVYLNRSNGLDEMRDSPGNSEENEDGEDDSDGLPPKKARLEEADEGGAPGPSSSSSFRMLADSIQRLGEIYEKIENSKKQQLMELEKMRMEFHRDLEVQKRHILERAQAEIAKIRQGDDDEEIDVSIENISG